MTDDDLIIIAESKNAVRDEDGNLKDGLDLFAYDNEGVGVSCYFAVVRCPSIKEDEINIPWSEVLKHAPLDALVEALKARPDTVVYQPTGETFVQLSPIPPPPEGVDGVCSRATSAGAEDLLMIVRRYGT